MVVENSYEAFYGSNDRLKALSSQELISIAASLLHLTAITILQVKNGPCHPCSQVLIAYSVQSFGAAGRFAKPSETSNPEGEDPEY